MKKCGIATVFTGYNYGSALQAYATKQICKQLGYDADIIKIKGLSQDRDIRFEKLFSIFIRLAKDPKKIKKLKAYKKKNINEQTKKLFNEFYSSVINPVNIKYRNLRQECKTKKYEFFICGSDQIWNSTIDYIDPFLYLRFIDKSKRIAFAPSFGRDYIAKENIKTISRYVSDIKYLSVREESGRKLIKENTGREAVVLIDPTLVLNKKEWIKSLGLKTKKTNSALLYFLDEPNESTKKMIAEYCIATNSRPIIILNNFSLNIDHSTINAGPKEFAELLLNCNHVFTDSYHGMLFSTNFNIDFTVFPREYGGATKQTTRIENFLKIINSKNLYNPKNKRDLMRKPNYKVINAIIKKEREKSFSYLKRAINEITNNEQ